MEKAGEVNSCLFELPLECKTTCLSSFTEKKYFNESLEEIEEREI